MSVSRAERKKSTQGNGGKLPARGKERAPTLPRGSPPSLQRGERERRRKERRGMLAQTPPDQPTITRFATPELGKGRRRDENTCTHTLLQHWQLLHA
jgi:hypothetical protein